MTYDAIAGFSAGVVQWAELLTDELIWSNFANVANDANVDARATAARLGFGEPGDMALQNLLTARSGLLVALAKLEAYETLAGRAKVGEAYALIGYIELLLAEDYCAGVPLDAVVSGGGIVYGMPLPTDSLLGVAEAHFDSALARAYGDPTVTGLASVGLGRTRLNRAEYGAAAAAVSTVPTSYVYNTELAPFGQSSGISGVNLFDAGLATAGYCPYINVAEREGGNGQNYRTAADPRLVLDSTANTTCDGGAWYYPVKFGEPSTYIPLATGLEARLIEAEAALQAGNPGTWAADLNALRADTADTHVAFIAGHSLPADSTTGATQIGRVDVQFRERAFWLFGTGTRLGDLRRLIRQYGRSAEAVFPTGAYANGMNPHLPASLPIYGTDVSLTLPTPAGGFVTTNPYYRGCLNHDA